ncbi:uncharacterized protein LOC141526216 [Cotesia typhae]|uniref:uncharacterized protein LOC141526216 n=1 Tax=Cotesia typhae TaxID=2053667 RepID=UPI003D6891EC
MFGRRISNTIEFIQKLTDMYGDFIEKSYFLEEKSQSYVEDKYLDRKDFISHPVYFAAHLLNPQLFNCPLVEADKIEAVNFIEKFAENLELNSQQVITDLGDYCTQQAVWSNKSLWTESKISNSITW